MLSEAQDMAGWCFLMAIVAINFFGYMGWLK